MLAAFAWVVHHGLGQRLLDDAIPDMGDAGSLDRANLLEFEVADVLKQPLAGTEQDRDDVQIELVDDASSEVLLNGLGPTSDQHILVSGCTPRLLQRGLDP